MRALPIAALLLLAACANGGNHQADIPGVNVADAALRGGSPQVAIRIDDAILEKDPRNVAALLNRGDAQTALQQSDAAAQSYTEALRADPDSIPARIGLGRLRLADDPAAAEALFAEVVRRAPRNAVALNDLGIARDLLGRHQEAQAAYRQTIGIDPSMNGARVNLALSLAMVGRADDAAPMLRPLASAPNAPRRLRHDLAAVLAMGGDRSQAQRILAQDLSPEQVNQALSIFTAASAPSGTVPAIGAPAPLSATPANNSPIHGSAVRGSATGEPAGGGSPGW
jgi:Flp pilus assembly protein TadD